MPKKRESVKIKALAFLKTHKGRKFHHTEIFTRLNEGKTMTHEGWVGYSTLQRQLNKMATDPKTGVNRNGDGRYWYALEDTETEKLDRYFGGEVH